MLTKVDWKSHVQVYFKYTSEVQVCDAEDIHSLYQSCCSLVDGLTGAKNWRRCPLYCPDCCLMAGTDTSVPQILPPDTLLHVFKVQVSQTQVKAPERANVCCMS